MLAGEVGKIDQAAFGDSTLWRTLPVNNWGAVSDLLALLDVLPADSTLTRPSLRAVAAGTHTTWMRIFYARTTPVYQGSAAAKCRMETTLNRTMMMTFDACESCPSICTNRHV